MHDDFLSRYLGCFGTIPGWCSPDACLMFMAYHQLLAEEGLAGDTLEIGVHHGLSAIGIAALRGDGRRFVAIDLFEERQSENVSRSGFGSRGRFLANMGRFFGDLSFLTTIAAPSSTLGADDLGREFTFCHVDGGHFEDEVYADLDLASAISLPGGLVALDDYFNPAFPGVSEGAVRFRLRRPHVLRPVAIGYNKVLFQREPAPFDLNARFRHRFPELFSATATLWGTAVPLFNTAVAAFIDHSQSTPRRIVAAAGNVGARIEPAHQRVTGCTGDTVSVPVQVTNLSRIPFNGGGSPFGLSYHLLTDDYQVLEFDHSRQWFIEPLAPGASRTIVVPVRIPDEPGQYALEFDIVWEGVLWMKNHGNPTACIELAAVAAGANAPSAASGAGLV